MTRKLTRYTTALAGLVVGASMFLPTADALIGGDKAPDNDTTAAIAQLLFAEKSEVDKVKANPNGGTISQTACTGTLIDDQWIIAAKHCAKQDSPVGEATFGVHATGKKYDIDKIVSHDTDDIALFRLKEKPEGITPVKTWDKDAITEFSKVSAYGWGDRDGQDRVRLADYLTTDGGTLDPRAVRGTPHNHMPVLPVSYDKARATQGDSGAPMIIDGKLYGVLSMRDITGNDTSVHGARGFYMPINNYAEWVNNTLSKKTVEDKKIPEKNQSETKGTKDSIVEVGSGVGDTGVSDKDTTTTPTTTAPTTTTPPKTPHVQGSDFEADRDTAVENTPGTTESQADTTQGIQYEMTPGTTTNGGNQQVAQQGTQLSPQRVQTASQGDDTPVGPKVNTGGKTQSDSIFAKVKKVVFG